MVLPAEFLITSEYCDADHPVIRELAHRLAQPCANDTQKAVALFEWVRDQIEYRLGLYRHAASETVGQRWGSCSNKANLLVALLRALGIPAGFHLFEVKTREYFGPVFLPAFHPFVSHRSLHIFCAIQLEGRWVRCDPSDDVQLSEGSQHLNPPSRKVEFDGRNDALLNLRPDHVLSDDGVILPHIDHILSKESRALPAFLHIMRLYATFLRQHGRNFSRVEDVQESFLPLLAREFPEGYALLREGASGSGTKRISA